MQKGIFAMLVLIAFLLGANLFKGNDVHAAKKYQWLITAYGDSREMQSQLSTNCNNGYEFVAIEQQYIIFRK